MKNKLLGTGFAVPPLRIANEGSLEVAKRLSCQSAREQQRVDAVYRRSGVQQRGSVLLSQSSVGSIQQDFFAPASDDSDRGPSTSQRSDRFAADAPSLAIASARQALEQANITAEKVTHLVVVSCTGFSAPGVDIDLIDGLGLSPTTQRVQVGFMGCHGAINGLRTARGLLAADEGSVVLVCCIELCSLHYQYGYDANRIVSGALFADGSASMVLSRNDSRPSIAELGDTGSYLIPDSRDAMTWTIGDHGFEMTLAATVPSLIESKLHSYLHAWLTDQGETIRSIGGWAVHPGGTRILTATASALGLESDQLQISREILAEHGNMSSATMPAVIHRFNALQQPRPWVMLGFGPGLEIEVAILR